MQDISKGVSACLDGDSASLVSVRGGHGVWVPVKAQDRKSLTLALRGCSAFPTAARYGIASAV